MKLANVTTMSGVDLSAANESVVIELEYLLDKAKSGELDGIAYAVSHMSGGVSHGRKGCTSNELIGSLERIKAHLIGEMAE